MLVLSRSVGESIQIGEDVVVKIVGKRGGQIRVGIDAPKNVKVVRSELGYTAEVKHVKSVRVFDSTGRVVCHGSMKQVASWIASRCEVES